MSELPSEFSRAGKLLHSILPFYFRAYHQQLGQESIYLHDAVTIAAAIYPELVETKEMAGDVETSGELTAGATIFDLREKPEWRPNMEVAVDIDVAAIQDCILRGLAQAGQLT